MNEAGRGIIQIIDRELNIRWSYFANPGGPAFPKVKFVEVLRFVAGDSSIRFPSYEQFISLVEGLDKAGHSILPKGRLFALDDKPARHDYLLSQIDGDPVQSPYLSTVDRNRVINGTKARITTYLTGIRVEPSFASALHVEQLWIHENPAIF